MNERDAHEIKGLLQEIRSILSSECTPFVKPLTQSLEIINDTINSGNRQIADNQQQIYNAILESNEQQRQEIELLKLQLSLAIIQNQVMLEALRHALPTASIAHLNLDSATAVINRATQAAAELNVPKAADPFK